MNFSPLMLPVSREAALVWLTVVALVPNSASNHSTFCFDPLIVLRTWVVTSVLSATGVLTLEPVRRRRTPLLVSHFPWLRCQ
jgi:hypothetical protein